MKEETMWAWVEIYDEPARERMREAILTGRVIGMRPIHPGMIQKLLTDYMLYGFVRNPRMLERIMDRFLWNICQLQQNTIACGHSQENPLEHFDVPRKEYDVWLELVMVGGPTSAMFEYDNLIEISDYGLDPLLKLTVEHMEASSPEESLQVMNRMLNVCHQRSDLSAIFVKGGSQVLDMIEEGRYVI